MDVLKTSHHEDSLLVTKSPTLSYQSLLEPSSASLNSPSPTTNNNNNSSTPPGQQKKLNLPIQSNYSTSTSLLSSFLTYQTTNPTSASSTNLHSSMSNSNAPAANTTSNNNNGPSSAQYSKYFKKTIGDYKRLSSELSKFNNKTGLQRTNHLRLLFLYFLRLQTDEVYYKVPKPHCYKPAITGIKVLVKWWQAILNALIDAKKPVAASQKSVYYECISRIITRYEWKFINENPNNDMLESNDANASEHNKNQQDSNMLVILLTKTLDYSINQLNSKNSASLSLSAFIGKIFALSFFQLKGVSNALLFLLNVRISTILTNYNLFFSDEENYNKIKLLSDEYKGIKNRYPANVQYLVNIDKLTYGMKLDHINSKSFKLDSRDKPNVVKLDFNNSLDEFIAKGRDANADLFGARAGTTTTKQVLGDNDGLQMMKNRTSMDSKKHTLLPPHTLPNKPRINSIQNPSIMKKSKPLVTAPHRKFNFNAIEPPRAPVKGINDPQGAWVKKWSHFNSDVFVSFLRHYLTLTSDALVNGNAEGKMLDANIRAENFLNDPKLNDINALIAAPGFNIIWGHLYDIIVCTINSSTSSNKKSCGNGASGGKSNSGNHWSQRFSTSAAANPFNGNNNMTLNFFSLSSLTSLSSTTDARKTTPLHAIAKVFLTLRDFLYNPRSINERIISKLVITSFDNLLITFARSVSAYDYLKAGYVLDLVQEFVTQVCSCYNAYDDQLFRLESTDADWFDSTKNSTMRCVNFCKAINWKFWLNAVQNMLSTENINCQLKALAFLFNVWDFIPDENNYINRTSTSPMHGFNSSHDPNNFFNESIKNHCHWLKNPNYSIKYNFTSWLVSHKNWSKFFCHWQPLVRSYYLRLIVWRLLSVKLDFMSILSSDLNYSNMDYSSSFATRRQPYSSTSLNSQNALYFSAFKNAKDVTTIDALTPPTTMTAESKIHSDSYINREKIRKIITDRLNFSYEKVIKISQFSSMGYYLMPDMNGSSPIVNRKFSITSINFKNTNENLFIDPNVSHINNTYNSFINDDSGSGSASSSGSSSPTDDKNNNMKNNGSKAGSINSEYLMMNGLVPNLNGSASHQLQVRKINPFEIFDDAVYSSTAFSSMCDENDDEVNFLTTSNTVLNNSTGNTGSNEQEEVNGKTNGNSKAKSEVKNKNAAAVGKNNDVANNSTNGGKNLLGFAFKLFKKSKSSTNINEGNANDAEATLLDASPSKSSMIEGESPKKKVLAESPAKKIAGSSSLADISQNEVSAREPLENFYCNGLPLSEPNTSLLRSGSVYGMRSDFLKKKEKSETSLALLKKSKSVKSRPTFEIGNVNSKSLVDINRLSTNGGKLNELINSNNSLTSFCSTNNLGSSNTSKRMSFVNGFKSIQSLTSVASTKTSSTETSEKSLSSFASYLSGNSTEEQTSIEEEPSVHLKHKTSVKSVKNFNSSKKRSGTLSSTSLKSLSSSVANTASTATGCSNIIGGKQQGLESIPLPPELHNKAPDIKRQLFKFSLVWHDDSLNYQLYVINNSGFSKFYNPSSYASFNANNKFPHYPMLPFSQSMGISYMPTDEEYTHNTELETEEFESDVENLSEDGGEGQEEVSATESSISHVSDSIPHPINTVSSEIGVKELDASTSNSRRVSASTFFTCSTELSPNMTPTSAFFNSNMKSSQQQDTNTVIHSPTLLENSEKFCSIDAVQDDNQKVPDKLPKVNGIGGEQKGHPRRKLSQEESHKKQLQKMKRERDTANETLRKWGTVGKSLNEWNDVVKEYEDFVRSRKIAFENQRLMNFNNDDHENYADYYNLNFVPLLIAEAPAPKINAS